MRCASKVKVSRSDLDGQLERTINEETKSSPEIRQALMVAQRDFQTILIRRRSF